MTTMISEWFDEAKKEGATHMLVVCDTFDYSDYPVPIMPGQDVHEVAKQYNGQNMQRLMEVYKMSMDKETQLKQHRAFNY